MDVHYGVYLGMYIPLWMSNILPLSVLVRVYDVILWEGADAIFFIAMNYGKEVLRSKL